MTGLPDWVADPALRPVWDRIRTRLEQAGLEPHGTVQVTAGTRQVRHALGELLGRTMTRDSVRVDLAELDARLRTRSGVGGLEQVLAALDGAPPLSRPAVRAAREASRDRPLALAAELVSAPWAADWVAGLRRTGLLTNREGNDDVVRDAVTILVELTNGVGEPRAQSRVELGARLVGDAHALDRDRLLHQVVLRGLAAAAQVPLPTTTPEREQLWERHGVQPDLLSRTCLVWGVRVDDPTPAAARRLDDAARCGDPIHLTDWELRRLGTFTPPPGARVLVCENPRVIEGIAERGLGRWAAVCTAGEPNLVVDKVLSNLVAGGADLYYHGDFDWPGVAIASRIMSRFGARPFRMAAADYVAAVRVEGPRLVGRPLEPPWDPELGAAMRSHGRAVHEESVMPELLEALEDG